MAILKVRAIQPYFDPKGNLLTLRLGSQNSIRQNSNPLGSQSQGSPPERSSQNPAVPQWPPKSSINSLLNDPIPGPSRALVTLHTEPALDPISTSRLLRTLLDQTSHCSVEQLEQIYSAMMSEIWRTRAEWDRGKVARSVHEIYEQVRNDIILCQGLEMSMETEDM